MVHWLHTRLSCQSVAAPHSVPGMLLVCWTVCGEAGRWAGPVAGEPNQAWLWLCCCCCCTCPPATRHTCQHSHQYLLPSTRTPHCTGLPAPHTCCHAHQPGPAGPHLLPRPPHYCIDWLGGRRVANCSINPRGRAEPGRGGAGRPPADIPVCHQQPRHYPHTLAAAQPGLSSAIKQAGRGCVGYGLCDSVMIPGVQCAACHRNHSVGCAAQPGHLATPGCSQLNSSLHFVVASQDQH